MKKNLLLVLCAVVVCFGKNYPKLQLGPNDFTMVFLPDMHVKSSGIGRTNADTIFTWLKNNSKQMKIKYVLDAGDMLEVDRDSSVKRWRVIDTLLTGFEVSNTPYSMILGNHSYDSTGKFHTVFDSLVPQSRYTSKWWFRGGFFADSTVSTIMYNTFIVGTQKYLLITFPYLVSSINQEKLDWVQSILAAHPNHYAIFQVHNWLNSDGERNALAAILYDSLKSYSNLRLVVSGHVIDSTPSTANRSDTATNGNLVNQFVCNYQTINNNDCVVRVMVFKPDSNKIYNYTYSTKDHTFRTKDKEQFAFYYSNGDLSAITKPDTVSFYYDLLPRQNYLNFNVGKNSTNYKIAMKDTRLNMSADTTASGALTTMFTGAASGIGRYAIIDMPALSNFVTPSVTLDSAKISLVSQSAISTASRSQLLSILKTPWGINDTTEGNNKTLADSGRPCPKWSFAQTTRWAAGGNFDTTTDAYAPFDSFTCVLNDLAGQRYYSSIKPYVDSLIDGKNVNGIMLRSRSTAGAAGTNFSTKEAIDTARPYISLWLTQKVPSFAYADIQDSLGDTVYYAPSITSVFDSVRITPALPSGYTQDTITGGIYGIADIYQPSTEYIVTGYNAAGTTADTFNIEILGCSAPSITTHPTSTSVIVPATASFSVSATGDAPLSYQWQKTSVNIGGATTSSYTTPTTTSADNGNKYRCVVSNTCGSTTSNEATLLAVSIPVLVSNRPEFSKLIGGGKDTLRGSYLYAVDTLRIGDSVMAGASLTKTDSTIIFTLPAYTKRGGVDIISISNTGARDTVFGLNYKNVHVSSISPVAGKATDTVTIRAIWGLGTSGLGIKFGDSTASIISGYTDTLVRVVAPTHPLGTVSVEVVNSSNDSTFSQWIYKKAGTSSRFRMSSFIFSF